MATLDRWRPYLAAPKTIAFPRLELKGRDFAPPLVVGSGEIRVPSLDRFEYTLTGIPEDPSYVVAALLAQRSNPYDHLSAFRLFGTDEDGMEWSLGWTVPGASPGKGPWTFTGSLNGISPHDECDSVSPDSSTEVIFLLPIDHPVAAALESIVRKRQINSTLPAPA